jgi:hypothetical protein
MHAYSEKLRLILRKAPGLWQYALILCVSLIFNWLIQLTYYVIVIRHNPSAFTGERTLLNYKTGIIGDVLLIPIINVAILYILLHIRPRPTTRAYIGIVLLGLLADAVLNFLQGYLKLDNWSMPKPYEWDFVSYWHMASFLLQISFVFLFFYVVIRSRDALKPNVLRATLSVFALIGIFILLFLYDYLPK